MTTADEWRVDADWTVETVGGVRLVGVRVYNPTPVARAVRVNVRTDGVVMPPRSDGLPEPGWDDAGFSGRVDAGERRALGFAVDAPVERPPVAVVDGGRPADGEADATAADACRALGSPRPPRDAVPTPGSASPREAARDPPTDRSSTAGREGDRSGGVVPRGPTGRDGDRVGDGEGSDGDGVRAAPRVDVASPGGSS